MKFLDLVKSRHSCRSYDGKCLTEADRNELDARLSGCPGNPFGASVRFAILDNDRMAGKKIGTYGVIKGAKRFLAGIVTRGDKDMESLGYSMERAVLEATDMGLGTCWLAGAYNRADFNDAIPLSDNERIVCVSPVGYPSAKPTALDTLMRKAAGSAKRKAWEELFFDGEAGRPLFRQAAGEYADALEAVRLAPSGSNGQPWRIVRRINRFDFYRNAKPGSDAGRVDMGITACHFELMARETGLDGAWECRMPADTAGNKLMYAFTWVAKP